MNWEVCKRFTNKQLQYLFSKKKKNQLKLFDVEVFDALLVSNWFAWVIKVFGYFKNVFVSFTCISLKLLTFKTQALTTFWTPTKYVSNFFFWHFLFTFNSFLLTDRLSSCACLQIWNPAAVFIRWDMKLQVEKVYSNQALHC